MIFYDLEVFNHDWLGVFKDMIHKEEYVIINDREALWQLYEANKNNVWVGFNNRHYDMYILKAILLGKDPKRVSDWIISGEFEGWQCFDNPYKLNTINYDVMMSTGRIGLKTIEGFMGADIRETDVDFNLNRKLTKEEIDMTVSYCRHDVEMTIEVFLKTVDVWNAMHGIVRAFPERVSLLDVGDSEARITAKVLGCVKQEEKYDEFDIFVFPCVKLDKYKYVQEWFEKKCDEANREGIYLSEGKKNTWYKSQSLEVDVAGIPHIFGFGGLHGAIDRPVHFSEADGAGYHVDVNNYYPSMLNAWGIVTRAAQNDNYLKIYKTRKKLKYKQTHASTKEEAKMYKKMQLPYKKMLNALSGAMKDKTNPAYDPRNNNIMCINGQLMLLDLIEHLEVIPGFRLVQSNTDGLIVWIPDTDEAFDMMDDVCWEWEKRCSTKICDIRLETDAIKEIYQKDVNNYLWIDREGGVERKGKYLKELSPIDYDLPIVNKALTDYMVKGTPVEDTVNSCDCLTDFQKIVKLSGKYDHVEHEHCKPVMMASGSKVIRTYPTYPKTDRYTYKAFRVFASLDMNDGRLLKVKADGKKEKFADTPDHCFIHNESTVGVSVPSKLDRKYYIDRCRDILKMFGLEK